MSDLIVPLVQRGADRRQTPQRAVDARMHYSREQLCAAALAVVRQRHSGNVPEGLAALRVLEAAAAAYLAAAEVAS